MDSQDLFLSSKNRLKILLLHRKYRKNEIENGLFNTISRLRISLDKIWIEAKKDDFLKN